MGRNCERRKKGLGKEKKQVEYTSEYELEGRIPLGRAILLGMQHVLAMFVSNLTPITMIGLASGLSGKELAVLLQNAMFVAGIATLIQLYPVWKVGAKLPIVMGVSFTFVTILSYVGGTYGYPTLIGAVLVGGVCEGVLGLFAKYWKRFITPVVSASVVTAIGYSLFTVGARSFGGGYTDDFGSVQNLVLGLVTLAVCLIFNAVAKGYLKQLSVLVGLIVGYIIALCMGQVDLSGMLDGGLISLPHLLPYRVRSFPLPLFLWYPQQKRLVIPPHLFPVDLVVRLQRKRFPEHWHVTVSQVPFPDYLDVRRLLPSVRTSVWSI